MTEQRFKTFAALRDFYRPIDMETTMRRPFTLIAEPTVDGWNVRALEAPGVTAAAPILLDALARISPAISKWANGAGSDIDAMTGSADDMAGTVD